jgi:hypothetical protein
MTMSMRFLLITAFLITFIQKIFSDYSPLIYAGRVRSLVLIDDWHIVDTHSIFWSQLRGKEFLI